MNNRCMQQPAACDRSYCQRENSCAERDASAPASLPETPEGSGPSDRDSRATQRVYKYELPLDDWISVRMPEGAEPLCVQVQRGKPCLWARVAVGNPPAVHHFRIAGTGHDLGSNVGRHIGSFQLAGGDLVLHVFAKAGASTRGRTA